MKKIHSILLRSVTFALCTVALASCVRPDLEGCVDERGNVRLTLSLDVDAASGRGETGRYTIDCAHVYAFDSQTKELMAYASGGTYTYEEEYVFYLNLDSGNYDFIVWTNQGEVYKLNQTITEDTRGVKMDELQLYYDHSAHDCASELIPDLLHGTQGREIKANRNNHVNVVMRPDTYNINVKVTGLPECDDRFDFSITDNNSHYTFDNSIVSGKGDFQHIQSCTQSDGKLNTSFRVLRLMRERSPKFIFGNTDTKTTLFENCLVQTILSAYETADLEVDFDKTHTFDIELKYDSNMDVTVSVNGWDYRPGNEDLE